MTEWLPKEHDILDILLVVIVFMLITMVLIVVNYSSALDKWFRNWYCNALQSEYKEDMCIKDNKVIYNFKDHGR